MEVFVEIAMLIFHHLMAGKKVTKPITVPKEVVAYRTYDKYGRVVWKPFRKTIKGRSLTNGLPLYEIMLNNGRRLMFSKTQRYPNTLWVIDSDITDAHIKEAIQERRRVSKFVGFVRDGVYKVIY